MSSRSRSTLLLGVLLFAAAASCGREGGLPTAASTPEPLVDRARSEATEEGVAQMEFYPLELGNRWRYVYTYSTQFRPGDGSPLEPPLVESTTTELEIVCNEEVDGRSYIVQRGTYKSGTRRFWTLFHQDRTGLYQGFSLRAPACDASPALNEGDLQFRAVDEVDWTRKIESVHEARARNAIRMASPILESRFERFAVELGLGRGRMGGPLGDEATALVYPLHPGASWNVRPARVASPLLAVVEGVDVLTLPTGRAPAYRIRYVDETPGSGNGDVRMWYGRAGYIGAVGHASYTIPSFGGAAPDTVVSDWTDVLDDVSLVSSPRRRAE